MEWKRVYLSCNEAFPKRSSLLGLLLLLQFRLFVDASTGIAWLLWAYLLSLFLVGRLRDLAPERTQVACRLVTSFVLAWSITWWLTKVVHQGLPVFPLLPMPSPMHQLLVLGMVAGMLSLYGIERLIAIPVVARTISDRRVFASVALLLILLLILPQAKSAGTLLLGLLSCTGVVAFFGKKERGRLDHWFNYLVHPAMVAAVVILVLLFIGVPSLSVALTALVTAFLLPTKWEMVGTVPQPKRVSLYCRHREV